MLDGWWQSFEIHHDGTRDIVWSLMSDSQTTRDQICELCVALHLDPPLWLRRCHKNIWHSSEVCRWTTAQHNEWRQPASFCCSDMEHEDFLMFTDLILCLPLQSWIQYKQFLWEAWEPCDISRYSSASTDEKQKDLSRRACCECNRCNSSLHIHGSKLFLYHSCHNTVTQRVFKPHICNDFWMGFRYNESNQLGLSDSIYTFDMLDYMATVQRVQPDVQAWDAGEKVWTDWKLGSLPQNSPSTLRPVNHS